MSKNVQLKANSRKQLLLTYVEDNLLISAFSPVTLQVDMTIHVLQHWISGPFHDFPQSHSVNSPNPKAALAMLMHGKIKSAFFLGFVVSQKMLVPNMILQDDHLFALAIIPSEFDSFYYPSN